MNVVYKIIDNWGENRNQWLVKLLIGGLLGFIPVVNLLSIGYVYRYVRGILREGQGSLPNWEDWGGLFMDGIKLLVLMVVFGGLPMGVLGLVSASLKPVLGWLAMLPVSVGVVYVPGVVAVVVYRTIRDRLVWHENLSQVGEIMRDYHRVGPMMVLANLALVGFVGAFWSVWGLAFFLGMLLYLPYSFSILIEYEK